jgi:hypothetical protein
MPDNIQESKLRKVIDLIRERLNAIRSLQKEAPRLEEARDELEWMLNSEEHAPEVTITLPSENVLHRLSLLQQYLVDHKIVAADPMGPYIISASGITSSSDYAVHVTEIHRLFLQNTEVARWHDSVMNGYQQLRTSHNRSEKASSRLGQLDDRLLDLHSRATDAALSTSAGVQSPIESAELIRELLISFKGELIRRCKVGKGTKYQRIAQNLAIDSQATLEAIIDQQQNYDELHHELAGIAKNRLQVPQKRLKELLANFEDHVLIITNSIDPEKIGFEFLP